MTELLLRPQLRSAALVLCGSAVCIALLSLAMTVSGADVEPAVRFPYDPVCPWGRVADGRGIIVRCLEQLEAERLVSAPRPAPLVAPSIASSAKPPPLSAAAPLAAAPSTSPAAASAGAPAVAPTLAQPSKPLRRVVVTDVGPAQADTGELPEAQRQLRRPLDRYARCVEDNGGLESESARVTLRFLVRERGRAEGVLVKDRRGISVAAAKCIADVVDRRYVGYPAAPIVGATLTIALGVEGAVR